METKDERNTRLLEQLRLCCKDADTADREWRLAIEVLENLQREQVDTPRGQHNEVMARVDGALRVASAKERRFHEQLVKVWATATAVAHV